MPEVDGWQPALSTQEQDIEAINGREELLLRAHAVARRIEERVREAMGQGPQAGNDRQASCANSARWENGFSKT
jgi:hypothetical protein